MVMEVAQGARPMRALARVQEVECAALHLLLAPPFLQD